MVELIIHPASLKTLDRLMIDLPQSLLLTGPVGVGLGTIARYVAAEVGDETLTVLPEKDDKVDLLKGVISVDSIRRLYAQTRSVHRDKLVIIIDYAERMGRPAQAAFLKLLEEPGDGIYFIVVTHDVARLLPTITSRAQRLELRHVSRAQSEALLDKLGIKNATKRQQMLFMASGLPAELIRLASDQIYFEARAGIMRDARDLLQASPYKKILVAHKYKTNRDDALILLDDACSILRHTITDKPDINLIAQIDQLLFAYQQIRANGNIRLCLARFVV